MTGIDFATRKRIHAEADAAFTAQYHAARRCGSSSSSARDQAKDARVHVFLSYGYRFCGFVRKSFAGDAADLYDRMYAWTQKHGAQDPAYPKISKAMAVILNDPANWITKPPCDNLVTPGFRYCPDCEENYA